VPGRLIKAPPLVPATKVTSRQKRAASRRGPPTLTYIEPCLAAEIGTPPSGEHWVHEIKEDGFRTVLCRERESVTLYSRGGHDWTKRYTTIAEDALDLPGGDLLIDGEMVVPRADGTTDFRALSKAVASYDSVPLQFRAFDILFRDGRDVRRLPLIERKALLQETLQKASHRFYFCEYAEIDGPEVWKHAHRVQAEGIISKRADSPYRSGRTSDWIKVPCQYRETFHIVGYAWEEGDRFDGLYLARRINGQLIYAGKMDRAGVKLAEIEPMMLRLDEIAIDKPPVKIETDKPKARWVKPSLKVRVVHRGGNPPRLVRHAEFEGWDETPEAPLLLDRLRARIAQSTIASKPIVPAIKRGVPVENIMRALDDAVVPTPGALSAHWQKVARQALPHLARRPLTLVRHVAGTTFYHMGPLPPLPKGVHSLKMRKADGKEGVRLWVDSLDGLLGLVGIGVVEVHPWAARIDDIERPDLMIFDLDPGKGIEWPFFLETALALRGILADEGFECWPKLTGGTGVHLIAEIDPTLTHKQLHAYAKSLSERLARTSPGQCTTIPGAEQRVGKLFIDYFRNGRGASAVGCYSPRARPSLPIALPTSWTALERGIRPDAFTLRARRRKI
jgi:bifunctional non-homologous end joining protein LigD